MNVFSKTSFVNRDGLEKLKIHLEQIPFLATIKSCRFIENDVIFLLNFFSFRKVWTAYSVNVRLSNIFDVSKLVHCIIECFFYVVDANEF